MQKPVYKRELSHSYLVIKDVPENKMSKYQYRMLIRNRIAGLLTCSERFIDGKTCLYYDISSRQSLAQIYEATGIGYSEIKGIIDNLAQVQTVMSEYLLEESSLILEPEYIFMDLETEQLFFLYYPLDKEEKERRNTYLSLAEFFLEHVDHSEENAVNAAYQFYKMSKSENFMIESFRTLLERGRPNEESAAPNKGSELFFREEEGVYEYKVNTRDDEVERWDNVPLEETDIEDIGVELLPHDEGKKIRSIAGTIVSSVLFLILCISIWYLQPEGQIRLVCYSVLMADVILFFVFLRKLVRGGSSRKEKQESFLPGSVVEQKKAEPGFYRLHDDYQADYTENDISGPTVFIGSAQKGLMTGDREKIKGKPRIKSLQDGEEDREYMLDRLPVMAGKLKSRVQILLSDASVSRIHARFVEKDGKVALIDMNSTNGTFVNDIRLEQEEIVILEDGDEIRFGNVEMQYLEI